MKKILFLFSVLAFNFYLSTLFANHENFNDSHLTLKVEILEMCEKHQEIKSQWLNAEDEQTEAELLEKRIQIEDLYLPRLKEIISIYGWPGFALIGKEGSYAMWLLIMNTHELNFQNQCLILLEQAVARQDADIFDFAFLKDRVLLFEGKKQMYGTHLQLINDKWTTYPIEDEEHVNERRFAIGLCSLENYIEHVRQVNEIKND